MTYSRNVIIMLLKYLPIVRAGSVSVDKGIVRISYLVFRDLKDIKMRGYIYVYVLPELALYRHVNNYK